MKKLLIVVLVILMVLVALVAALPSSARTDQPGEPPGWSQNNDGQGGSDGPGQGGPSDGAVGTSR